MDSGGYNATRDDLDALLIRRLFPERTSRESSILRDFLYAHGHEFDRYEFSRKVGPGQASDPAHLPGVQKNAVESSRRRIDLLVWRGPQPVIVECKERVQPAALGQIQHYRDLLLAELPELPLPELVIIGRYSDASTLDFLRANGVTVFLYEATNA